MFKFIERLILKIKRKEIQGPKTRIQLYEEAHYRAHEGLINDTYAVSEKDLVKYSRIFANLNVLLAKMHGMKPVMIHSFSPKIDSRYYYHYRTRQGKIEIGLEFNNAYIVNHIPFRNEVARAINKKLPDDIDYQIFVFLHEWGHHFQYQNGQYSKNDALYISDSGELFRKHYATHAWEHPHLPWEKDAHMFALSHYLYFKEKGII